MAFLFERGIEIGGRYRLLEPLGGDVLEDDWAATDLESGRRVVLRLLRGVGAGTRAVAHVWRAAMLVERLGHEGAMPIVDVQQSGPLEDAIPIVVSPEFEGETFDRWLRSEPRSLRDAMDVIREVVDVLDVAHSAVDSRGRPAPLEHLGLRPSEIFVGRKWYRGPNGSGAMSVRLLDLGLMRDRVDEDDRGTITMVGSPRFESPEMFISPDLVGPWSDVWSIGVMIYVVSSGRYPYGEENDTPFMIQWRIAEENCRPLDEIAEGIPMELVALVDRCLSHDLSSRFESARELGAALDALPRIPKHLPAHPLPRVALGNGRVASAWAQGARPVASAWGQSATCESESWETSASDDSARDEIAPADRSEDVRAPEQSAADENESSESTQTERTASAEDASAADTNTADANTADTNTVDAIAPFAGEPDANASSAAPLDSGPAAEVESAESEWDDHAPVERELLATLIAARAASSLPPPPDEAPSIAPRRRGAVFGAAALGLVAALSIGYIVPRSSKAAVSGLPASSVAMSASALGLGQVDRVGAAVPETPPLVAELVAENPFRALPHPSEPKLLGCAQPPPLARMQVETMMPMRPIRMSMISNGVLGGLPRTGTCDDHERRDEHGRCWVMGCPRNSSSDGAGHCAVYREVRIPLQSCLRPDANVASVSRDGVELQAHEVTWAELGRFLTATGSRAFIGVDVATSEVRGNVWDGTVPREAASLPAHGVPRLLADTYCRAIDARLPSEAELETAARGASFAAAPWGDVPVAYGSQVPALESRWAPPRAAADPSSIDRTSAREPIFDLVSNVREWAAERYHPDTRAHRALPTAGIPTIPAKDARSYGVVRGLPRVIPSDWPRVRGSEDLSALIPVPGAYRSPVCAAHDGSISAPGACVGRSSPGYLSALRDVGFRCARTFTSP